jgi:hypothetical protein
MEAIQHYFKALIKSMVWSFKSAGVVGKNNSVLVSPKVEKKNTSFIETKRLETSISQGSVMADDPKPPPPPPPPPPPQINFV